MNKIKTVLLLLVLLLALVRCYPAEKSPIVSETQFNENLEVSDEDTISEWVNLNSPVEGFYCYAFFKTSYSGHLGYGYSGVHCNNEEWTNFGSFAQVQWSESSIPIPGEEVCWEYISTSYSGRLGYGYSGLWCR